LIGAGLTADEYVLNIVRKYSVPTGNTSFAYQAGQHFVPVIREWAGNWLLNTSYSGSFAKGTAVHGDADVDLFVSLSTETPYTLGQIFQNLYQFFSARKYPLRQQEVSVRISFLSCSVDIVPGRKQKGLGNDHSLYRRSKDSWTQTNVQDHIKLVQGSGRQNEIRALKIWRHLHSIEFPSFFLELTVLRALTGCSLYSPGVNTLRALRFVANNIETIRIQDPSNSNNLVSDDLTAPQKARLAAQATHSADQPTWGAIIW
jgi:hypothetical protein